MWTVVWKRSKIDNYKYNIKTSCECIFFHICLTAGGCFWWSCAQFTCMRVHLRRGHSDLQQTNFKPLRGGQKLQWQKHIPYKILNKRLNTNMVTLLQATKFKEKCSFDKLHITYFAHTHWFLASMWHLQPDIGDNFWNPNYLYFDFFNVFFSFVQSKHMKKDILFKCLF